MLELKTKTGNNIQVRALDQDNEIEIYFIRDDAST